MISDEPDLDDEIEKYFSLRKLVLLVALLVMMVISIYQYSWSLFAYSIQEELGWNLSVIGLTFTIFSYAATFIQPFSGLIADSHGPRKIAFAASILVGVGFILSSFASAPEVLYVFYGLGGIGVGMLYGVSTATAIKWFPDKRGFATGLVVFGFGAGTAIFNLIIEGLLGSIGFRTTFVYIGILMLLVTLPSSLFYGYPSDEIVRKIFGDKRGDSKQSESHKPLDMLKTYQWYLIYFSFTFTAAIVLIFGAQMKLLAAEFNIPLEYFDAVLIFFPIGNGLSRVVAGTVSDKIGREKTMMIFYALLGMSILALVEFGYVPLVFLVTVFLAALLGGSPFALYPATIGDYYGSKYSTSNYGLTYTAKAWAGLISGWLSGTLVVLLGSYRTPLILISICCLFAALISNPKFLKRPN